MIEVKGKYNTAIIYSDEYDDTAYAQILELCNQESLAESHIRIMPDYHAGKGCVIGTTMQIKDKIIPNLVGVDIGCLDKNHEVMTTKGWIKISDYDNQDILVYNTRTDEAYFEKPYAYIKQPCDKFYHIKSKYGLDQMVSEDHRVLVWKGYGQKPRTPEVWNAQDLVEHHNSLKKPFAGGIKTTFNLQHKGLGFSDIDIKIFAMLSADGCIRDRMLPTVNHYVEFHFSKQRKIDRAIQLLSAGGYSYQQTECKNGSMIITTKLPLFFSKDLSCFYNASQYELRVLAEESLLWDGHMENAENHNDHTFYSTTIKVNADVIQYAFASTGRRFGMHKRIYKKENWKDCYYVYETNNSIVGFPSSKFETINITGEYKYCFTVSTGAFVTRRNNCISLTGNCGVVCVNLGKRNINLENLDKFIRKNIPSGKNAHDTCVLPGIKEHIDNLKCVERLKDKEWIYNSIGTLGGGNHFIELAKDKADNIYLLIHTGSRNLGTQVAKYYQDLAYMSLTDTRQAKQDIVNRLKQAGRESEIQEALKSIDTNKINKDLAYLENDNYGDYLHDMARTQEYAHNNRYVIARLICDYLGMNILFAIESVHNYIDIDSKILRKGAVRASKGEKLIIPINMQYGSLICRGKGNPDWNYSAPHGAGRILSRSQAKKAITLDMFEESMKGIYTTSVNSGTIDESPFAYKNPESIISNIGDTVEIIDVIKPIYNFKAEE